MSYGRRFTIDQKIKEIDITRFLALNTGIYFAIISNKRASNINAMAGCTINMSHENRE
jgi:hypothetical protein